VAFPCFGTKSSDFSSRGKEAEFAIPHALNPDPSALSGRLESDLARQRLGKGMSAYDHVLLQGRDKYFKPRETTEVSLS